MPSHSKNIGGFVPSKIGVATEGGTVVELHLRVIAARRASSSPSSCCARNRHHIGISAG